MRIRAAVRSLTFSLSPFFFAQDNERSGEVKTNRLAMMALFLAVAFVAGCAGAQLKNPADMTPKEKAILVMKLYNKQVADVLAMEKQAVSPELKALVEKKKEFLRQAAVPIDIYVGYIDGGMQPTEAMESQIVALIDKLLLEK